MRKTLTILFLILSTLSGCTTTEEPALTRYTNVATDVGFKDIAVTFVAYTKTQEEFNAYFDQMKSAYIELGHLYDKYNDFEGLNNLKTINDNAGKQAIQVDQRLIDLLLHSREWFEKSNRTFDITLGAVLNIWHDYRDEGKSANQNTPIAYGKVPTIEELTSANACTGWDNVVIDDVADTVFITNPCTQLDVGGVGKGFATDIVAKQLKDAGLTTAILNIGESSIVTIGSKPDGTEWGVGIAQPKRPILISDSSVDTVYFPADISISTSGDNQNYYLADDGVYYHHLIDPVTLFPVASGLHSVTVYTTLSAGDAEALSKALYIQDYAQASAYLSSMQKAYPDDFIGAVWIYDLGEAPEGTQSIDNETFTLVHSENLVEKSRLYR